MDMTSFDEDMLCCLPFQDFSILRTLRTAEGLQQGELKPFYCPEGRRNQLRRWYSKKHVELDYEISCIFTTSGLNSWYFILMMLGVLNLTISFGRYFNLTETTQSNACIYYWS
jgi:hypothetical protein